MEAIAFQMEHGNRVYQVVIVMVILTFCNM